MSFFGIFSKKNFQPKKEKKLITTKPTSLTSTLRAPLFRSFNHRESHLVGNLLILASDPPYTPPIEKF